VWLVSAVPREAVLEPRAQLIDDDSMRGVARFEYLHNAAGPKSGTECERPIEVPHDEPISHVLRLRTHKTTCVLLPLTAVWRS